MKACTADAEILFFEKFVYFWSVKKRKDESSYTTGVAGSGGY